MKFDKAKMGHKNNKVPDDPKLRDLIERREKFLRDMNSSRLTAERRARNEGLAEGRVAGLAEGRVEGEVEGRISTLIRILTKRLGPLSDELTTRISQLKNITDIERLVDIALDVPSLELFENEI